MDPLVKDWIDTISKFVGFIGVGVGALMAFWQVRKARIERAEQADAALREREKELETRRLNLNVARATFWLTLRRMFTDHHDVHIGLRPNGAWSKAFPDDALPKVEAYMGLFEHCKLMLEDQLIDIETFKRIYAYRVKNIVRNPTIVFSKLMNNAKGWKDFIGLVVKLDLWPLLNETERQCLQRSDAQDWLQSERGQTWHRVMKELDIDVSAQN